MKEIISNKATLINAIKKHFLFSLFRFLIDLKRIFLLFLEVLIPDSLGVSIQALMVFKLSWCLTLFE